jgi:pantetheine-phosphate adenylyltransferase
LSTVKAIYPGSFDPLTNGHLDLVARGAKIFDHLVVAILNNSEKAPLFSVAERIEMITEAVTPFGNVSVATFNGLLVEFVVKERAQAILRGVRAISDYEYELQMALMNRRLAPQVETVFLMADEKYSYVSSRLIKNVFERWLRRRVGSRNRHSPFAGSRRPQPRLAPDLHRALAIDCFHPPCPASPTKNCVAHSSLLLLLV